MKPNDQPAPIAPTPQMIRQGDPCQDSWRQRISFKLMFGLVLLFGLFSLSTYLAMRLRGREVIAEQSDRLSHELGRKLVLQLQEHIEASEALARTLATLGATLPADIGTYKQIVPGVINLENKRALIAGGGIWPEPDAFTPGVARRSFFWGRNREGLLEYYDDYNALDGPGYHREEWYEPARHSRPGRVYWSRSYMDPYSFEPMVTCTAPIHRDGKFIGVATVDLKLNGLATIMTELARQTGGHAFVVDRNNNFICLQDASLASIVRQDASGKTIQEQRDAGSVARERPEFFPVAQEFARIDQAAWRRIRAEGGHLLPDLTQRLLANINQLTPAEADRISIGLLSPPPVTLLAHPLELTNDVILRERVQMLVHEMPSTHWKVALAMPVRLTQAAIDSIVERVALFLFATSLVVCLFGWIYFRQNFAQPLQHLTHDLRQLAEQQDLQGRLPVRGHDELARLAYWFNVRTDHLARAYTDLKEQSHQIDIARQAAERADRSKNIFLASMSHELRTPLNAIIGMSSFLQGSSLNEEQNEYARTIHSSSNALLDLVNDIMDFSKIEAGQLELEKTDFDLRSILDEVSDMLAYTANEKGLRFSCLLEPGGESWLNGDPGRIRQIIANLAANAVKFTKQGEVEIRCRTTQDGSPHGLKLEFTVRDTGVGIPDSVRDRMFKPYSQGVSSTTRQFGGTGLGLAICKQLCLLMHGDIDFTSKPKTGTTFHFEVRLGRGDETRQPDPLPLCSLQGEWHCFVLEPHFEHGDYLSRQLRQWGLPSTHVPSLEQLPGLIASVPVNSVLLLCGIDPRSQPDLGPRLQASWVGRTARTILHHQSNFSGHEMEDKSVLFHAYLPKPLRTAQLIRSITTLLTPQSSAAPTGATQTYTPAADLAQQSVLVVEDNLLNQKVILKMLRNLGLSSELAENGAEAVEMIRRKKYDVVLMDWHMPVMDGLEATRAIRQFGGDHATIPIIALTASALQNEREQCFAAGMNDYLSKPITEKNLKVTLQKWLHLKSTTIPFSP